MSKFVSGRDGYFFLTRQGYIALVVLILIALFLTVFVAGKKQDTKKTAAIQLAFSGIALALAFITSYIKYEMPMGGSVTLFSMFFICYIGYLYGIRVGFLTAFSYSILQFIQGGGAYILTPFQTCCDYFFAFTALGIAGLWYQKKHGLTIGYIAACLLRGLFHTIGGYLYWMDYMPESFPKSLTAIYPIVYNYSYILIEMTATLLIINLPPVKKALGKVSELC